MSGRCCLTGFKILAKNLPPLKAKLPETTHEVDINSCKRIIKEAKKKPEPEQEWLNGVVITKV